MAKGTTAELVERLLVNNNRKTILSGHRARPVCSVVEQTRDLDFLILQVNSFQLERTEFFRPAVAVLMNVTPDHHERYASTEDYIRANGRAAFKTSRPSTGQSFKPRRSQNCGNSAFRSRQKSLPSAPLIHRRTFIWTAGSSSAGWATGRGR